MLLRQERNYLSSYACWYLYLLMNILVVGAGVFGVTAALELARRGHDVRLADPGPLPHPDASSTDINKIVRLDYGAEAHWTELAELAREGWLDWNQQLGEILFHEVGMACLTSTAMEPGSFERDSFDLLVSRGWKLDRLDADGIAATLPAFRSQHYADGYLNPFAGWSPSGRVVELLLAQAQQAGVKIESECRVVELMTNGSRVVGIRDDQAVEHFADLVLVAAGAWTPTLLPELDAYMACIGQPVVHLRVEDAEQFRPPNFAVWTSDIGTTGWYGFPATGDGILKIGNHGPGRRLRATDRKVVDPVDVSNCRRFLKTCLPSIAESPVVEERLCLYCDTFDHAFWIDYHPERPGLFVATGGSGHGFKFAPVLGNIISDVVERHPNPWASRFSWREPGAAIFESCRRLS